MRHRGDHFLVHRHFLLYGALHADQTDAELVLQQLTNGADAAIAEMIDIIHLADVLAQLEQVRNNAVEIRRFKNTLIERRGEIQLDVELQPADA